jgi:4-amino-4-deoxy-L-arabinose transferase-like glycosyltransferase
MKNRLLFVLLLSTFVFAANFWGYPIYILDEAKNAACAMEMHQRGDWVVPTFNDALRTDKPPLHYFFMIISYKLFGVSPFSARLFSVIMGMGCSLLIYWFGKKCINERSGFLAALVFICSLQASVQFHMAVPDPYLITFITASLCCFFYGYHYKQSRYFYLSYISLAFAFLAKGPVAIVLVALPLFIYLLIRKEFTLSVLRNIKLLQGIGLFLIIASPWWIAVTIQTHGEWVKGFLFDHNLNRFSSTMEGHKGIPGVALACLFGALLPLSFFLPQSIISAWKKRNEYPFILLALLVCVVVIFFFSISRTFLPGYIGPCLPFGALLLGFYFDQWVSKNEITGISWISFAIGAIISIGIPIGGYFALQLEFKNEQIATKAFYLFPLIIGTLTAFWYLIRKQILSAVQISLGTYLISSMILFYTAIPAMLNENPVTQLSPYYHTTSDFVIFKGTNSAFIFNTGNTVPVLETKQEVDQFLIQHPAGIVLTRQSHLEELDTVQMNVFRKKDLFENPVTVILKRRD